MIRFASVAALLASITMTPTMAKDPPNDEAVEVDPTQKVCKRQVKTGSVMPRSVCRTRAEWGAMSARSRSDLDRVQAMERSRETVGASRN